MTTLIFDSFQQFLDRPNKKVNGVTRIFARKHPNYKEMNETNTGCYNCAGCIECDNCFLCIKCIAAVGLRNAFGKNFTTEAELGAGLSYPEFISFIATSGRVPTPHIDSFIEEMTTEDEEPVPFLGFSSIESFMACMAVAALSSVAIIAIICSKVF